jgi:plastocyanin
MKILLGFIVLLVAVVAISGCTQYSQPAAKAATTATTSVPTTEVTTVPPTTEMTTVPVTVATTAPVIANVTVTVPTATTGIPTPIATTPWTASQVAKIHFNSTGFFPANDVVLPGTGVTWINDDTVTHTIIATGNNTGLFNSGDIVPGAQYVFTFCEGYECRIMGTYTYALKDLPAVNGTIVVQAGPSLVGMP